MTGWSRTWPGLTGARPPGWWCTATGPCTAPTTTGTTAPSSRPEPGLACRCSNCGASRLVSTRCPVSIHWCGHRVCWPGTGWTWRCGRTSTATSGCCPCWGGAWCPGPALTSPTPSPGPRSTSPQVTGTSSSSEGHSGHCLGSAGCREKHDKFMKNPPEWSAFRCNNTITLAL